MSVINLEQPYMGEDPDALSRYLYRLVEQINYNLLQLDKELSAAVSNTIPSSDGAALGAIGVKSFTGEVITLADAEGRNVKVQIEKQDGYRPVWAWVRSTFGYVYGIDSESVSVWFRNNSGASRTFTPGVDVLYVRED